MFKSILLSLFIFLAALSSAASEKEWAEVRSPHFRVITDGS
jgi:hypothetical protein